MLLNPVERSHLHFWDCMIKFYKGKMQYGHLVHKKDLGKEILLRLRRIGTRFDKMAVKP